MKIIHRFINCLACGNKMEILDDMLDYDAAICDVCGYTNEFTDFRVEVYYEEY